MRGGSPGPMSWSRTAGIVTSSLGSSVPALSTTVNSVPFGMTQHSSFCSMLHFSLSQQQAFVIVAVKDAEKVGSLSTLRLTLHSFSTLILHGGFGGWQVSRLPSTKSLSTACSSCEARDSARKLAIQISLPSSSLMLIPPSKKAPGGNVPESPNFGV